MAPIHLGNPNRAISSRTGTQRYGWPDVWVIAGVIASSLVLAFVPFPMGTALGVSALFIASVYAGFLHEPKVARLFAALVWVALGAGLLVADEGHSGAFWVVFGATAVGTTEVLSRATGRLSALAMTDPLTGLPNRIGLWQAYERDVALCRRLNIPLTLVHIDLDGFKEINDRAGHAEGDRVLQLCAVEWSARIRAGDTLARLGGDEFLLLVPGSSHTDVEGMLARLQAVSPVDWCYGVAELQRDEDIDSCIARADAGLYAAKAARGRR